MFGDKVVVELSEIFNIVMDNLRMLLKIKRSRVSEKDIDQRVTKNAMVQNLIKYFVEKCTISVPFGIISLVRDVRKECEHYCEWLPIIPYCVKKNKKGEYRRNDKKDISRQTQKEKQWLVWIDNDG